MFKVENDNQKTGSYLKFLIEQSKYPKIRQFAKAYLEKSGITKPSEQQINNMNNKMVQITKGNQSIQVYDLPIICELLNVSCEEIITAGKHYVPISGHITNYEIAFSKDSAKWQEYLDRDDKIFLNSDEYNKTVIDYAFEFKNYDFLKFLMDNNYIWFVDNSKKEAYERTYSFGAGTSIKPKKIAPGYFLEGELCSDENKLRQNMIYLAIENEDCDTLTKLRARETPALYSACCYIKPQIKNKDYYDKRVIDEIVNANQKILGYFSEEFSIIDQFENEHWFMYPYIQAVLEQLIEKKNKYSEVLLRRAIEHNQKVYDKLSLMMSEAFELSKKLYSADEYKLPVEDVINIAMHYFNFDDDGYMFYMFIKSKKRSPKFCANVIRINSKSDDLLINSLIEQLNKSYKAIKNIKPDTSNY